MTDKTLSKGLLILELLAEAGQPLSLSEISETTKLTRSNVHRLLQTLKLMGYVEQASKGAGYEVSLKLWEVGCLILSRLDVTQIARDHLKELAKQTHETVHLSVLSGFEVIYIDKIDSPHPVRTYSRVGGRAPAHRVATGKVLLAALPKEYQQEILSKVESIEAGKLDAILSDLAVVRELGYAYNYGEWRHSVNGLAAPVKDRNGEVISAVGISGPSERLGKRKLKQLTSLVIESAEKISRAMGYNKLTMARTTTGANLKRRIV
jgi:DNA-binding IclR family transcriptional regulator